MLIKITLSGNLFFSAIIFLSYVICGVGMIDSKQWSNLKDYKELIETIAKIEYQKLSASIHLIEYLELVNIGTHTLYILFKNNSPDQFNTSYLSTAIKWAIRNEVRRRYKWYSIKQRKQLAKNPEDLREALYKTILSIDEMAEADNPTQFKATDKAPDEVMEFFELKKDITNAITKLPAREKELIEQKFFNNKKLKELSEEFNISPSRISRIIQSGLNKIKKELGKQDIF